MSMVLNINDEQGIELLYFIFERELKPPFTKGEKDKYGYYPYYNRDGEIIGQLYSPRKNFMVNHNPFYFNISDKVHQAFEFFPYNLDWWFVIIPHLKSWMEDQINIKLDDIG